MSALSSERIVAEARSWIGTPYRHQASLKGVGCDCLGLVRGVWRGLLGPEPEKAPSYSADWAEAAGRDQLLEAARRHLVEIPVEDLGPGSVVLFRWRQHLPAKHAAIVATPTTIVHAYEAAAVAETHLGEWWQRHLFHAFRFPGAID
ncbi:MAG: peptidase P60 [Hyphomicrobiales bacterium]|nr:MAG: peptidase P60 [Hyphomicrobiales bacterium]